MGGTFAQTAGNFNPAYFLAGLERRTLPRAPADKTFLLASAEIFPQNFPSRA